MNDAANAELTRPRRRLPRVKVDLSPGEVQAGPKRYRGHPATGAVLDEVSRAGRDCEAAEREADQLEGPALSLYRPATRSQWTSTPALKQRVIYIGEQVADPEAARVALKTHTLPSTARDAQQVPRGLWTVNENFR